MFYLRILDVYPVQFMKKTILCGDMDKSIWNRLVTIVIHSLRHSTYLKPASTQNALSLKSWHILRFYIAEAIPSIKLDNTFNDKPIEAISSIYNAG